MIEALDIQVRGIVQGVGFRPFVYRLARRYLVSGWVLNSREGVFIHAEAESKLLDGFVTELHENSPAAAHITELELKEVPLLECEGFEIRTSDDADVDETTLVSADLATCDDCLAELFDPDNRRYHYPFINCTNCGPRFTIIESLPYDRPATSMASFEMCPECAREYADPADRRFHAQPDACWECGPQVSWQVAGKEGVFWGSAPMWSDVIFDTAADLLAEGSIIAVKGLGGFHLVCDAGNTGALMTLRERKHRDGKAFAVMAPDLEAARSIGHVGKAEAELLTSPARPIVLLRKLGENVLAPGLADKLPEVGVMLPSTPVQHLLIKRFQQITGKNLLVMTSGNVHDEPIVIDDAEAAEKLLHRVDADGREHGIADAMLGNDRPIRARYDDSVVRVVRVGGVDDQGLPNEAVQFVRRARGYAPVPLAIPTAPDAPDVFAVGPEQKNTFTYTQGAQAFVSQHVGDLEDADTYDAWVEARECYQRLFDLKPQLLACDMHPEYLATKWAQGQAAAQGLPLVEVQHHHAHLAAVLGEHNLEGPAIGIAFDGTGYGADGAIWGGEVLLVNQADYERFANFSYMPMPGGVAAIKNPMRMAYGLLWACDLLDHPGARWMLDALGSEQATLCEQMIERGLNTPYTSSAGRLFDAISALVGVCPHPTYEGEAAILLDAVRAEVTGSSDSADAPSETSRSASSPSARALRSSPECGEEDVQRVSEGASAESGAAAIADVAPEVLARYAVTFAKNSATPESTAHDTSVVVMDMQPTVLAVLDDMVADVPVAQISLRFHAAVVQAILHACELARAMYGIDLVALSGGCFMNRFLVEQAAHVLGDAGFTVALPANLPPNDGCISYGQAVVARAAR